MSDEVDIEKVLKLTEDELSPPTRLNEFDKYLLESLIEKGLSGKELVEKFSEAKSNAGWTIFRPIDEDKPK